MSDYYILDGHNPVVEPDFKAWVNWYESADRKVARDHFRDVRVSTVFLAMDHQFDNGPPLLFETMIFGGKQDDYCERYSTWDQAVEGHKRACVLVMSDVF